MNKLYIAIQKGVSTVVSAMIPFKDLRHKVRYILHPLNDRKCLKYFSHHYVCHKNYDNSITNYKTNPKVCNCSIWTCWFQGIDNAPTLVQNCIRSIKKNKKEYQEIIIITEENYEEYVTLPSFIIKKRKHGIISDAQFSDILRIYLLDSYGGFWIDATCLLTSTIPDSIEKSDIFMFHSYGEFDFTLIQSCFIHAKKGNYLIHRWKQLMTELWHNESFLLHYFQLHLMFKAMVLFEGNATKEYKKMLYVTDKDMHLFFHMMREEVLYSDKLYDEIKKMSFIHKLTYKLKPEDGNSPMTFRKFFWQPHLLT